MAYEIRHNFSVSLLLFKILVSDVLIATSTIAWVFKKIFFHFTLLSYTFKSCLSSTCQIHLIPFQTSCLHFFFHATNENIFLSTLIFNITFQSSLYLFRSKSSILIILASNRLTETKLFILAFTHCFLNDSKRVFKICN